MKKPGSRSILKPGFLVVKRSSKFPTNMRGFWGSFSFLFHLIPAVFVIEFLTSRWWIIKEYLLVALGLTMSAPGTSCSRCGQEWPYLIATHHKYEKTHDENNILYYHVLRLILCSTNAERRCMLTIAYRILFCIFKCLRGTTWRKFTWLLSLWGDWRALPLLFDNQFG